MRIIRLYANNILDTLRQLESQEWKRWNGQQSALQLNSLTQYLQTNKTDPNYDKVTKAVQTALPSMKSMQNVANNPALNKQVKQLEDSLQNAPAVENTSQQPSGDMASRRRGQY